MWFFFFLNIFIIKHKKDMKKVVRIKESELVNLIDKIITETTRKQKITEGVRNLAGKQIINEEMVLKEDALVLKNYGKQLYSLFKKEGATPLLDFGGKKVTSPDVKNQNVFISAYGDVLHVDIRGVNKANAQKYGNLVAKQFPDLELKKGLSGEYIEIGSGWGGEEKDSYARLTLGPKTTRKGGEVNPNQRPNAPKPQA